MTDQQHPITPPIELVQQWMTEARSQDYCSLTEQVAHRAAQWGYDQRGEVNEAKLQQARDQELEACCEWLEQQRQRNYPTPGLPFALRAARRPKPPSLKEQALEIFEDAPGPDYPRAMTVLNAEQHALIRRALEALPDD